MAYYNNNKRYDNHNNKKRQPNNNSKHEPVMDLDYLLNTSMDDDMKMDTDYKESRNPMIKFTTGDVYTRDDMYNALTKKDGLVNIISDLRDAQHKNKKIPYYIKYLFNDIIFASVLLDAINKLLKEDNFGESVINKDDVDYILDQILYFLGKSYDDKLIEKYGKDAVNSMRNAYINILYKFNKKKVKKFKKDIKNMSDSMVKQLVVLSAGGELHTIYRLLKFLYSEVDEFSFNKKNLTKIFKICYGKDNMKDIIKYLMLERVPSSIDEKVQDVWVIIDKIIRDELEDMGKKDIEKVILGYVNDRKRQESNGRIQRRFGDRRSIHPDDYPKITKVCDKIETEDISAITYLR